SAAVRPLPRRALHDRPRPLARAAAGRGLRRAGAASARRARRDARPRALPPRSRYAGRSSPRRLPTLRGGPMSEPPLPQAEEGIALGRVIATGLACLAVGALSLVAVYALLRPDDALGRGAYSAPRSDSTPSQALFERAGEAPPRPEAGHVLDSY